MSRTLQERTTHEDGSPITEWYPTPEHEVAPLPPHASEREWRDYVRKLNAAAKERGDTTRYRSVERDDDSFG